jgi:hypothetical protein
MGHSIALLIAVACFLSLLLSKQHPSVQIQIGKFNQTIKFLCQSLIDQGDQSSSAP